MKKNVDYFGFSKIKDKDTRHKVAALVAIARVYRDQCFVWRAENPPKPDPEKGFLELTWPIELRIADALLNQWERTLPTEIKEFMTTEESEV